MYNKTGFGDCYMFKINRNQFIDATFRGSLARYVNHSCDPNCQALVIEVEGENKIIMYA